MKNLFGFLRLLIVITIGYASYRATTQLIKGDPGIIISMIYPEQSPPNSSEKTEK